MKIPLCPDSLTIVKRPAGAPRLLILSDLITRLTVRERTEVVA
jgi:hypothetical protein